MAGRVSTLTTLIEAARSTRLRTARRDGLQGLVGLASQIFVTEKLRAPRLSEESSRIPWRIREALRKIPNQSFGIFAPNKIPPTERLLRYLLISHDLSPSGAPKLLAEIALLLEEEGCEVLVASPRDGPMRALLNSYGVYVLVGERLFIGGDPLAEIARSADVVLVNTTVAAYVINLLDHCAHTVLYLHEIELLELYLASETHGQQLRDALGKADAVWAGSEPTARVVRRLRPDARVVPYGTNPKEFGSRPLSTKIRLSVFGSFEPRKGQDLMVAALKLLPAETLEMLEMRMYGRVLERDFYRALVDTVSCFPLVKLEGELDYGEYTRAMSQCDVVVVPSRSDTLPLVSLDAMSGGRTVLCTSTTGTADYITDGVNGFVAESATSASLAETLKRLVVARDQLPAIAEAGRELFQREFSRDTFKKRLLDESSGARST